jgi:hypothetical protein
VSAPDGDLLRLELCDVGAADRVDTLLVELGRIDTSDVVGLEDLGIEHRVMLSTEGSRFTDGPPLP